MNIRFREFDKIGKSHALSKHGIVVSSHQLASQLGFLMLSEGANAVDTAIGMSIVLCFVEPHMTGIGGDCFALVSKTGQTSDINVINASGYAGRKYDLDFFKKNQINSIDSCSPHSVTIPGAVHGWSELHKRYGFLPWKEIFNYAIKTVEQGIIISERVSQDWKENENKLKFDSDTKTTFLKGKNAFEFLDTFKNELLVDSLISISEEGPIAFYEGEITKNIVKKLNELGGLQTEDDFKNYKSKWTTPIKYNYRGYDIFEAPPNGQGFIVFLILEIMKHFNLGKLSIENYYHLYCETVKIAYEIRDNFIADEFLNKIDYRNLLNQKNIEKYVKMIDLEKSKNAKNLKLPNHKDTIYLTVRDKNGMIISFINSLFDQFGSAITAPNTGILLHCRGKSFSLDKGHPNEIYGNKRPLHTIIPAMIGKEKNIVGSFGVMGGHYQAAGHAFVLSQIFDFGLSPQLALDLPRIFPYNGVLEVEKSFDLNILKALSNKGHNIKISSSPIGGGQIIFLSEKNKILMGASDWRKDGVALGL